MSNPIIKKAKGVWIKDDTGKKYIDLTSEGCISGLGHSHPLLTEAIKKQAALMDSAHPNHIFENTIKIGKKKYKISREQLKLALRETTLSLLAKPCQPVFSVSGGTAIVTAMRMAKITKLLKDAPKNIIKDILMGRKKSPLFYFLAFENAYHGQIGDAQLITDSKPVHRVGASWGSEVIRLPFPYKQMDPAIKKDYIKKVSKILENSKKRYSWRLAGLVFEPIQGDARLPDSRLLRELCNKVKKENILLIADEIKTGLGRTGKMFACEHFGIRPDLLVVSKFLGNGRATGAVIANKTVPLLNFPASWKADTYAAEPLVCAVGIVGIHILKQKKLIKQVKGLGIYLLKELKSRLGKFQEVITIDGKGFFIGIEMSSKKIRDEFYDNALKNGLRTSKLGRSRRETTIGLFPPFITTKNQIKKALDIIEKSAVQTLSYKR